MTGVRCPVCDAEVERDEPDPDGIDPLCPACRESLDDPPRPEGSIPPTAIGLVVVLVGVPVMLLAGYVAAGWRHPEAAAAVLLGWAAVGSGPGFGVAFGSWVARSAVRVVAHALLVLAGLMLVGGLLTLCLVVGFGLVLGSVPVAVYGALLAALASHPDLDRWCRR